MFLKVALGLLLTLPLSAYIAGTLVASQADMPEQRAPVVIEVSPSELPTTTPTGPRPSPSQSPDDDDAGRGEDDDRSGSGRGGDDDVRIVRPTPREVDEDDLEDRADDLADEREDRADDSDDGSHGD